MLADFRFLYRFNYAAETLFLCLDLIDTVIGRFLYIKKLDQCMGSCKVFKRDVFLFPSGAIPNCFQI